MKAARLIALTLALAAALSAAQAQEARSDMATRHAAITCAHGVADWIIQHDHSYLPEFMYLVMEHHCMRASPDLGDAETAIRTLRTAENDYLCMWDVLAYVNQIRAYWLTDLPFPGLDTLPRAHLEKLTLDIALMAAEHHCLTPAESKP